MMAAMGVSKLGKGAAKRPPRQPPRPAPLPPRRPAPEDPQVTLAKLRGEVSRLTEQLAAATTTAAAHEQTATAARAEAEAAAAAAAAQTEELTALRVDVERLDHERRALQRQLNEAPDEAPATPAARVFTDRGLTPGDEHHEALAELAVQRPAGLLAALVLADPAPLADLLDRRVVLAGPDAAPTGDAVVIRVSTDRCELGGASDVAAAWHRFAEACTAAGVRRVTVVGGSPTYRKQLKDLVALGVGPELRMVSGTQRRPKHKADNDIRNSDLVLVWGGTELDHAVSGPYTDAKSGKVVVIAHRGISGMLDKALREIDRWARL